jgi:hypothetical protein
LARAKLNLDKLPSHRRDWLEVFTLPARQPAMAGMCCEACVFGTSRGERHNCGRYEDILVDTKPPVSNPHPVIPYTPAIIIRRPRKINVVEI